VKHRFQIAASAKLTRLSCGIASDALGPAHLSSL
jgi:hypothetical protein